MRVLLVAPGAMTPFVDRGLARGLAGLGHDVRLATAPFAYGSVPDPSPATAELVFSRFACRAALLGWPRLRRVCNALALPVGWSRVGRIVDRWQPDVVHLTWSFTPRWESALLRAWNRGGTTTVTTVHNASPHDRPVRRRSRALGRLLSSSGAVIAPSRYTARRIATAASVDIDRIRVVPLGADPPERPVSRDVARKTLDLPPDLPVVAFCGLLRPYKGVDTLLEAIGLVRTSVRLLIAGLPLAPVRAALRAEIERRGLGDVVETDFRYLSLEDLELRVAAADVVVLPYRRASQSGLAPWVQALGRPLIVSAAGGLPEQIEPDLTGLVVPPDSPAALAAALEDLLSDPARREEMGRRGAQLAGVRYSWREIAGRTVGVYEETRGSSAAAVDERADP